MRLFIILTATVALAFALIAGAAETERGSTTTTKTITITLTKAQVDAVKNARGKNATITLTKEQITAIGNSMSGYNVNQELTLTTANVSSNNTVELELLAPDDVTSYLKMNPQPSP
jgi:hypothetical protein